MILYQNGLKNIVSPLGTSLSKEHIIKLSSYTKKIILLLDADEAGKKAIYKIMDVYLAIDEIDVDLYILSLPNLYDPLEYILKYGYSSFKEILKKEEKFSFFYVKDQVKLLESENTSVRKREVLRSIYEVIYKMKNEIEKEDMLYYLSVLLNIRKQAIWKDYQYFIKSRKKYRVDNKKEEITNTIKINLEIYFILLLIFNIEYFFEYEDKISNLFLEDSFAKKVLSILLKYNKNCGFSKEEQKKRFLYFLLEKLSSKEKQFLQEEIFNERYYVESKTQMKEILDKIYLDKIKKQINKITDEFNWIRRNRKKDLDEERIKFLMEEKHYWVNEYYKYKKKSDL